MTAREYFEDVARAVREHRDAELLLEFGPESGPDGCGGADPSAGGPVVSRFASDERAREVMRATEETIGEALRRIEELRRVFSRKADAVELRYVDQVWNLRGKSLTLDRLAPRIVRRASKMASPPIAIVIDPIYKVMTGDENSASDMGAFCNLFDYIARETGAAVIYCHHQSKGAQGFKTAMDRASGSGVFARDPDAMLDVSELVLDEDGEQMPEADGTPFEATWITREFRPPATQKVWFRYPVHVIDESGALDRAGVAGSAKAQSEAKKREKRRRRQDDMLVKSKVNSAVLRALAGEYAGVEVVKREDVIGYVADAIGDAMDDYNYDDFFNARNRFAAFRYVRIAGNEFGLVPCRNPQALFFDDTDLEVYQNMCTSGGTPI